MRYVVSRDGTGDFATIQAAVDAAKAASPEEAEIFVRNGEYRERVVLNAPRLRLVGESAEGVAITWSACAKDTFPDGAEKGTFLSFTLLTAAPDVTVENLTVRNDAGDGRLVGQAVAVYAAGDRGVWRNCRMIACQDTLFCGPLMPKVEREVAPRACDAECVPFVGDCPPTHSRQYFERCYIQGDVDFIFGPYRCWFEGCTLYMNARGGWYTAANTPEVQRWGMVFDRCALTGACVAGMGYLGRPWRKFARTLFIGCDMDACVSPLGFMDWDENRVVTDRLGEWGTTGARADQSVRHPMQKRLTDAEARGITPALVLSGWDPVGGDGALRCDCTFPPAQGGDMGVDAFLSRYLSQFEPYKRYWNYEDGCVLKGCIDLYRATGEPVFRDFVLTYLDRTVLPDGSIPNFPLDSYNIDSINCGKALFFALDETGDERYRVAADFHAARLETHPRCACGNFWHKEIYPDQIWLDGLYMAQPFRAEYMVRFGDPLGLRDIAAQFRNVRRYLYNEEKGLYYHACDMARKQPWANRETGCSANFWLRSMGWYLMALVDCLELMDDRAREPWQALRDLFVEAVSGIVRWRDPQTGLYFQVIDRADVPGNYLETSGSAMVLYALMKGVRLGVLEGGTYLKAAREGFRSLCALKLRRDEDGVLRLHDICKVAGLGPGEKRDGSVEYYLSEPRVADDAKGVGPWMMALAKYIQCGREER